MTPQGDFHDPLNAWYVAGGPDEAREEGEWTAPTEAQRNLVFALLMAVVFVFALAALAALYALFAASPALVL